jgi:CheY-like chemotaxis protein
LLDASRAANGKIVLQLTPVRLRDVIDAAVESVAPGIARRRQRLTVSLPEADLTITGDFVRLTQAFANMLVNASKFSDESGAIAVVATRNDARVDIVVSDDGAGIPSDLQPFIFDMFTQGQRTLDRVQGGLGIGLSMVQIIIELHGGTTSVASDGIGAGSVFTVTLPLALAARPPAAPVETAPAVVARNILIIEDNTDANEMLSMLLEMEGHKVTSSFDGADGLRRALTGQFDIVLCDLGLPELTGFEVIASLRAARSHGGPFVVATTGYSDSAQRDLARAAGFDDYLVKPIDMPALYRLIARYEV